MSVSCFPKRNLKDPFPKFFKIRLLLTIGFFFCPKRRLGLKLGIGLLKGNRIRYRLPECPCGGGVHGSNRVFIQPFHCFTFPLAWQSQCGYGRTIWIHYPWQLMRLAKLMICSTQMNDPELMICSVGAHAELSNQLFVPSGASKCASRCSESKCNPVSGLFLSAAMLEGSYSSHNHELWTPARTGDNFHIDPKPRSKCYWIFLGEALHSVERETPSERGP